MGVLVGHGPAAVAHAGVATGLRDCLPPEQQARAGRVPFADRLGQAVVGAAHVPHGGEATLHHAPQDVARPGGYVGRRPLRLCGEVCGARGHMYVGVDESGKDRASSCIYDGTLGKRLHLAAADLGEHIVGDEDARPFGVCVGVDIKDSGIPDQGRGFARPSVRRRGRSVSSAHSTGRCSSRSAATDGVPMPISPTNSAPHRRWCIADWTGSAGTATSRSGCDVARELAGWHTLALLWLTVPDMELRAVGHRVASWPETRTCAAVASPTNLALFENLRSFEHLEEVLIRIATKCRGSPSPNDGWCCGR